MTVKEDSKYDVLTLHREFDNVCVVRLRGFDNLVFWREIKLTPRWWHRKSPRTRIIDAQDAARKKADELRHADEYAAHEFSISQRSSL